MQNLLLTNLTKGDSKCSNHKGSTSDTSKSTHKVPSSIARMSVPTGNLSGAIKRGWNPSKSTVLSSMRSKSSGKVVGSIKSIPLSRGNMTGSIKNTASTVKATKLSNTPVRTNRPASISVGKKNSPVKVSGSDALKTTSSFSRSDSMKGISSSSGNGKLNSLKSMSYSPDFHSPCSSRGESAGKLLDSGGSTYTIQTPERGPSFVQPGTEKDAPGLSEITKLTKAYPPDFHSPCSSQHESAGKLSDREENTYNISKSVQTMRSSTWKKPGSVRKFPSLAKSASTKKGGNNQDLPSISKSLEKKGKRSVPLNETCNDVPQSYVNQTSAENHANLSQNKSNTSSSVGSSEIKKDKTGLDHVESTKPSTPGSFKCLSVSEAPSVTIQDVPDNPENINTLIMSNSSHDKSATSKASVSVKSMTADGRKNDKVHRQDSDAVKQSETLPEKISQSQKPRTQTKYESNQRSATFPTLNENAGCSGKVMTNKIASGLRSISNPLSSSGNEYESKTHCSSSTNTEQLYLSMMSNALSISDFAPFNESSESWKPKEVEEVAAKNPGSSIERLGNWTTRNVETPAGEGVFVGPVGYCVSLPSNFSAGTVSGGDTTPVSSILLPEKKTKDNTT